MLTFLCIDHPAAGRMNVSMLTDQQSIELFFVPASAEAHTDVIQGDEDDVCSWTSVDCVDGVVKRIMWINDWHGVIDFQYLPAQIHVLTLSQSALYGSIDTSNLPRSMLHVLIGACFFTGTVDCGNLPPNLQDFYIAHNQLSGIVNIQHLPASLINFQVMEAGIAYVPIHVGKLPDSELLLDLSECAYPRDDITFDDPEDQKRVIWFLEE